MTHTYLDNAATTPLSSAVIDAMTTQMQSDFGNASSTHWFGRQAHTALDNARQVLAQSINATPHDIVITSGATEANNTAILQTAHTRANLGKHIITTAIEHPSVLKPLAQLEEEGYRVTYLPVNSDGVISLDDFEAALDDETILVTMMTGNNEIGSVMPIKAIGARLKDHQAWLHTDATQAYGLLDIDVLDWGVDLLSVSAHKINGPKGIGFLYRGPKILFPSLLKGGEQENKRRAGTENVVSAVGFAAAVKALTPDVKKEHRARYWAFKQHLLEELKQGGLDVEINGPFNEDSLNHVFNVWLKRASTYAVQTNLDLAGFAVSGGSACTAGSLEPSHVLTALYGEDSPRIAESIRVSFGTQTSEEDVDAFAKALIKIVSRLREKSAR